MRHCLVLLGSAQHKPHWCPAINISSDLSHFSYTIRDLHSFRAAAETQAHSQVHINRHREKLNVQLLLLPARKASLTISGASSGGEHIMAPETLQEPREIFSEDEVFTRSNNTQKFFLVTV